MGSHASLVLTWHRLHPPQGGAALRNWQNVRALAELGPVDVVSIGAGPGGPPPPPVRRWTHFDLARLPAARGPLAELRRRSWWIRPCAHPWSMALWHAEIVAEVKRMVQTGGSELVVLEELWFHPYCELIRRLGCRTIFDAHNVEGPLRKELASAELGFVARLRNRRLTRQVFALERDLVRRADQTWCCSAVDAGNLGCGARGQRVHVIPNTVDVEHYRPVRDGSLAPPSAPRQRAPVIAFVGAYAYPPNEMAARILVQQVLPALEREHADVSLLLVGRDPTAWMLEAARTRRGVRVTGAVADVRPHLAEASVVAVPLTQGGGTRLKILEAFAARRPVVSTPKGAEGLDAVNGQHLLLREIDGFAGAILALLSDPTACTGLTERALAFVEQHHSWPVAAARVGAAVTELLQPRPSAPTEPP